MLKFFNKKDRIYIYYKKKNVKKYFFLFVAFFFIFISTAYFIENYFLAIYQIKGKTMEPTLQQGEWVLANKIKSANNLKRGDIVILNYHQEKSLLTTLLDFPVFIITLGIIKLDKDKMIFRRVLATANERVKIENKNIYINNKRFTPHWLIEYQDFRILANNTLPRDNLEEIFIPKGKVFLINDNWDLSNDSRTMGLFSLENIAGFYSRKITEIE